jgi:soluble lytic murein transglycosylase-like protein
MYRARTDDPSQTAAAYESEGSGCFSAYLLPPMAVIVVGTLLALFVFTVTPENLAAQAAPQRTTARNPILDTAVGAFLPDPATEVPGSGSDQATIDKIARPPVAPPQAALQLAFPNVAIQVAPASTSTALSPVFTPEVQYWGDAISRWASAAGIDPNLAAVVMQIESCGDPSATSGSGAMGLFQVMPFHFTASDSPYDPDTNALRGLDYLRRSLAAAHNDARLALAGYNGGIGLISRSEWTWPAETVRYAYWGSGIYADATAGLSESSRLNEWITAGGSGLCARAGQRLGIDN